VAGTGEELGRRAAPFLLWFAVLGGAAAWTAHLLLAWGLEEIACSPVSAGPDVLGVSPSVWIGVLTAALAAVTVAAGLLAWRFWLEEGAADPNASIEPGAGDPEPEELVRSGRAGFMALFGLAANALFLLMIVYGGVSLLLLRPCTRT
jgi:hypothetical protein